MTSCACDATSGNATLALQPGMPSARRSMPGARAALTSVMLTKEAINRAFETTQAEGVRFERRVFQSMFATEDQKEGMAAFLEKRPAAFKNR